MYSDGRSETIDMEIMAWNADDKIDNDQNNHELSMGIEMIQSAVVGKTSSTKSDLKEKHWKTSYLVPPEDFLESLQVENAQSLTISGTESAKRDEAMVFEERLKPKLGYKLQPNAKGIVEIQPPTDHMARKIKIEQVELVLMVNCLKSMIETEYTTTVRL